MRQVLEVEKDAFPTLWPPTPFKREMQNKLATYLVAVTFQASIGEGPSQNGTQGSTTVAAPSKSLWLRWLGSLARRIVLSEERHNDEYVLGYLGLWRMVDDSHIVSIGVRTPHRRHGIGEALLIRAIETSLEWGERAITLEVRASNFAAQALYNKYGFRKMGVRKRYYMDNNEDAYIMTTDPIGTEKYQQHFRRLRAQHAQKLV